jgi:hypothetical protein
VENFFWTCEAAPEEENSRSRKIFSRVFGLMSLRDDSTPPTRRAEDSLKRFKGIDPSLILSFRYIYGIHIYNVAKYNCMQMGFERGFRGARIPAKAIHQDFGRVPKV